MKRYEKVQPFEQPRFDRTWAEGVRRERVRLGVLVVMFVVGAVVMPSFPLGGVVLMVAATLATVATIVAGRYY